MLAYLLQGLSDDFLNLKFVAADHLDGLFQLRAQAGSLRLSPPVIANQLFRHLAVLMEVLSTSARAEPWQQQLI